MRIVPRHLRPKPSRDGSHARTTQAYWLQSVEEA
jgi:hypothetical protein